MNQTQGEVVGASTYSHSFRNLGHSWLFLVGIWNRGQSLELRVSLVGCDLPSRWDGVKWDWVTRLWAGVYWRSAWLCRESTHTGPETLFEWVTTVKEKSLFSFFLLFWCLVALKVILLTVHFCMNSKGNQMKNINLKSTGILSLERKGFVLLFFPQIIWFRSKKFYVYISLVLFLAFVSLDKCF